MTWIGCDILNLDDIGIKVKKNIDDIIKNELFIDKNYHSKNNLLLKIKYNQVTVKNVYIKQEIYPIVENDYEIEVFIAGACSDNDDFKKDIIDKYKDKYPDCRVPILKMNWF